MNALLPQAGGNARAVPGEGWAPSVLLPADRNQRRSAPGLHTRASWPIEDKWWSTLRAHHHTASLCSCSQACSSGSGERGLTPAVHKAITGAAA